MKTRAVISSRAAEAVRQFRLSGTIFGTNAYSALKRSICEFGARRVFLVCDPAAPSIEGFANFLGEFYPIAGSHLTTSVPANVTPAYIDLAGMHCAEEACDLIVAFGGGATMDAAKLIGLRASNRKPILQLLDASNSPNRIPLIAVPTTAGTGSESTHFAVLYVDRIKHSVADPSLRPVLAIVDPDLTHSAPTRVAAAAGLDALCQSIESLWSLKANEASVAYARVALDLAARSLPAAVLERDREAQQDMCAAAHLAGHAIDISFTTASHALSYRLTSEYQIPHGIAVASTLPAMILFNSQAEAANLSGEGACRIRSCMELLANTLHADGLEETVRQLVLLIRSVGGAASVAELNLRADFSPSILSESVNLQRLANNPRPISAADIEQVVATRFDEAGNCVHKTS